MKVKGNGQGKILTAEELTRLFDNGFISQRDRCLFAICLFTGCRISEALALQKSDVKGNTITFRKSTTKGKLKTRAIDIPPALQAYLSDYKYPISYYNPYLFPSREGKALSRFMADKILRSACQRIGVDGVSTHSFRRTALTQMHNAGVPLRHIQAISGHRSLTSLERYLGVTEKQKFNAISALDF